MLKTNLPERTHPLAEVLRTYKGQSQVERRFHHLKGPLAVAPMFLKNPDRIAGLLCVLVWALMVLALMERQVRRELKGEPLYGLYPEGRPSPAPTGPSLIQGLSGLCDRDRPSGRRRSPAAWPSPTRRNAASSSYLGSTLNDSKPSNGGAECEYLATWRTVQRPVRTWDC